LPTGRITISCRLRSWKKLVTVHKRGLLGRFDS
jgi:hypothetical protein